MHRRSLISFEEKFSLIGEIAKRVNDLPGYRAFMDSAPLINVKLHMQKHIGVDPTERYMLELMFKYDLDEMFTSIFDLDKGFFKKYLRISFRRNLTSEVTESRPRFISPGEAGDGAGGDRTGCPERHLEGEAVVEVPKKLWINPDTVAASDIGGLCRGLKPWMAVALFLVREKGRPDSAWRPYIDILPECRSEEELLELQGTQLLNTTLGVKEYVQREFLRIEKKIILPNRGLFPSPITVDNFLWTRAFSRMPGESLVLVPLADLVNHSPSITTEGTSWEVRGTGFFSRELVFSLQTPIYVKAGEQVYIQYELGKSNADLALDYGFIESRSDRVVYTLTLEIPESDPFYGDKLDILESNGLKETEYFDIVLGKLFHLICCHICESIFRNSIWGHLELPISRANEELICQVIRDACKSALSAYHTTIEEDQNLRESGKLSPRLEIAIGVREGEKKVLQQIDGIFKDRETELDGLEYYQERRLRDLGLACDQDEIIFWESK
ncbi:hypothetical protein QJS10_CPB18g01446 [Acorus calamus]|uniref:Rubisco LSMT substrate-binding domain-containing protein n=1 Tax=Acorus calamus TaxID=4465 RepID=A0AAV9CMZ7_ACOCL|nr:hypothetical protein QJS10_CPB18g01446 [Acorus calamus]